MKTPRLMTCLVAASCTIALLAAEAHAADSPSERAGLAFGLAVGVGAVSTQDCAAGDCAARASFARLSLPNLKLGWMLQPGLALWAYVPTGVHLRDGHPRAFESIMPALQGWVTDRVWLLGGVSAALDFPLLGTTEGGFHVGPGGAIAAGVEVGRWGGSVLDLQVRVMGGLIFLDGGVKRRAGALDALIGFNWY